MSSSSYRNLAGWTALALLAAVPAFADGASPAGGVTPLDLSPPVSRSQDAGVDYLPTGAIRPQPLPLRSPSAPSRLDLAPPPGLLPDLPPDAPTPHPGLQGLLDPPAAVAKVSVEAPAAAIVEASAPPDRPSAEAEEKPRTQIIEEAIRAHINRQLAAKPVGRPIGAGDWAAARQAVSALYAEQGNAPLWLTDERFSPAAKAAIARLARAREDGLDLSATPPPAAKLDTASPEALAQAEVSLSLAVVAYAMQASGARINPRALSKDVSAKPQVLDPTFALKKVANSDHPEATLAGFNPQQDGYRALRTALAEQRAQSEQVARRLAPGPVLKLGMTDPRVPLIRARFGLGALTDPVVSEVYDVRVASAVAAFQRVHGLPANGALTEATATALDGAGQASRERLILANMEMWRWQPREMGDTRVEVNVPDFSLKLTSGGEVVFRTRVIIGKPDTPTPIFSNSIKYMLFNPVWRVPDSIIKKEMAPKLAADPNYFARHGYKVSYVGDRMVVEQPPGEANALGRMLFLFPNEHAVYLHDTPGRSLFSASYRALSHGCVRVEDPARLGEILMGGAARGWSVAKVRSLVGDKERTFSLPAPVPVHLQYFTEFVDESGALQERPDLYGLTAKVAAALANLRQD